MNKRGLLIIVVAFALICTNFAYAEIFLSSQPDNTYNLGDTISVVLGSDGSEGWASVDLVCSNQSKMIYFRYLTDETAIQIFAPLTKTFLRGMMNNCHLVLTFNGKPKESFVFVISDNIGVSATIQGESFMPGESVNISGSVVKANQKPVNGFAEIKFENTEASVVVPIVNDRFETNFTIPNNFAAGTYKISVFVYEKDTKTEDITNYGKAETTLSVKQKPTKLKLIYPEKAFPGKEFSFKSILYDQVDSIIEKASVEYKLTDVNEQVVISKLATTGEDNFFTPEKNAPYGNWKIYAESQGIIAESVIYIEKNMEASFELANGTLVIRNIGNVPYERKVEMKIGNTTNVTYLNLSVGGQVEFPLSAPDGAYDVGVNDGIESAEWKGVPLTGSVISFNSSKDKALGFFNKNNFLAWLFIIGVFGLFIFLSSKKVMKKNVFLNANDKQKYTPIRPPVSNSKPFVPMAAVVKKDDSVKGGVVKVTAGKDNKPMFDNDNGFAEHSLIISGERENASLVAVKLKNFMELKNSNAGTRENYAQDCIKKSIQVILDKKGKVYKTSDFIVGIFSANITKSSESELTCIQAAKSISEILKSHNAKFAQKINYGVGINFGDIVAKRENGKFLFTALGNSMSNAKKIAEVSTGEVLISEEMNRKLSNKIKTAPNVMSERFGIKTFSLGAVVTREQNSKFVEDFLKRNNDYKTLRDMRKPVNNNVQNQNNNFNNQQSPKYNNNQRPNNNPQNNQRPAFDLDRL